MKSLFSLPSRTLKALNRIEILRANIEHNFYTFKKLLPKKHVFPVLKSNAYGHGIAQIARILQKEDFPYFAVDSYYEALQIWNICKKNVLIIGYNHPENYRHFNFRRTSVAIYDLASLEALASLQKPVRIHLKINTGLNRLGILPAELPKYLEMLKKMPKIHLEGVYSHFSSADEANETVTKQQENIFSDCLEVIKSSGFDPEFIHLGNTAGALETSDARVNAYRLGIGLYGYNPLTNEDTNFSKLEKLRPALRFISTVVNTILLKKGESVGYNQTFTAPKDMNIAVVPVGYYEALPRKLSNTGFFAANNEYLPIVGRIHMNLTCCDQKNLHLKIGDEIEIIGTQKDAPNSIVHIAEACGTIPYEILVNLSESVRRGIV